MGTPDPHNINRGSLIAGPAQGSSSVSLPLLACRCLLAVVESASLVSGNFIRLHHVAKCRDNISPLVTLPCQSPLRLVGGVG